jgi:hypothetical protein
MSALIRPHAPVNLDMSTPHSSTEAISTGAIVDLLVVRLSPNHIATQSHMPLWMIEEPVTWEDAEWQ